MGETGTGKEVVAKAIPRLSGRHGSFQAISCAAIQHNLLESELFGYRRCAFSGADRDKPGLVKLADGGTLFLDEIGDMPLDAQAKLLRVLQSREVLPVGGTTPERVDLRIVCATHRHLYRHVREGSFRGDLLARVNDHVAYLPPLRDRKEDVYLHLLTQTRIRTISRHERQHRRKKSFVPSSSSTRATSLRLDASSAKSACKSTAGSRSSGSISRNTADGPITTARRSERDRSSLRESWHLQS